MHKNQFDKIRILAALVVIFSHHFPLTGTRAPAWLENQWLHWSVISQYQKMLSIIEKSLARY